MLTEFPDMITVIDVMRAMGVEPTKRMNWETGRDVGKLWRDKYGKRPYYAVREKTSGHGNHHFAVYPKSWFNKIAEIVRKYRSVARDAEKAKEKDKGVTLEHPQ